MLVLKQIVLFASIFLASLGLGSEEEVFQDEDLERVIGGQWDAEQAVLQELESQSASVRVFWKDEKSTPPSSLKYKSADNETLLDVCNLLVFSRNML